MLLRSLLMKVLWLSGCVVLAGLGRPAEAAQSVVLKYGILSESISVPDLSHFAETGELSTSLKTHLRTANTEPEQLQQVLTQEIEIDSLILSKALNSLPGELLLDRVGDVISTPTGTASRQSLRAALVSSALNDNDITLMEVLENYPTADVHVEGEQLVAAYQRLDRVLGVLSDLGLN